MAFIIPATTDHNTRNTSIPVAVGDTRFSGAPGGSVVQQLLVVDGAVNRKQAAHTPAASSRAAACYLGEQSTSEAILYARPTEKQRAEFLMRGGNL